jgi:dTMP kinase
VVLEGADGSGKTTQARGLVAELQARGRDVEHVRDPGGTRLSEAVRRLLLRPDHDRLTVEAETLLYMAARAQLVSEVIRPALESGRMVVCERWTLSTEVYQGEAGGLGPEKVRALARVLDGLEPDLVLVLDVAIGRGLARLKREPDRIESKSGAFHERVVRGYRRLARGRARTRTIPPGGPDEVRERVLREVLARVG